MLKHCRRTPSKDIDDGCTEPYAGERGSPDGTVYDVPVSYGSYLRRTSFGLGELPAYPESGYCEHSIVGVRASVMVYDDSLKKWQPSGSLPAGISKVHIYHHPGNNTFRVVGRKVADQEVVINSAIPKGLKYNEATPTFHQWRDNRQVYGLNFSSKEDAIEFSQAMSNALDQLSGNIPRVVAAAPPPPMFSQPTQQGYTEFAPDYDDRFRGQAADQSDNRWQQPGNQGGWNSYQMSGSQREATPQPRPAIPDQMRQDIRVPSTPPVSSQPPVPVSAPPAPTMAPPAPPVAPPVLAAAPPAPPMGPPAPPVLGPPGGAPPPPPPPMPPGGIPTAPALPSLASHSSGGDSGGSAMGGLAAALATAKLRKTTPKSDSPAAGSAGSTLPRSGSAASTSGTLQRTSANSPAGGGGMDFMAEMQKKLARRQAATDGDPAPPVSKPLPEVPVVKSSNGPRTESPKPQRNLAIEAMHQSHSMDSISGGMATLPRVKHSGALTPTRASILPNGPSSTGASSSLSPELEQLKQEILAEMKTELQQWKQDIIDAIRNEMRH